MPSLFSVLVVIFAIWFFFGDVVDAWLLLTIKEHLKKRDAKKKRGKNSMPALMLLSGRMKMYWIRGFLPGSGPSPRSAGRMIMLIFITSIRPTRL